MHRCFVYLIDYAGFNCGLAFDGRCCNNRFALHYAAFGSWSFFTYSGWCAVVLLGSINRLAESAKNMIIFTIGASLLFWLWTNFGTWCATSLYPHNITGLIECYYAALPFLRNSALGAMCWSCMIMYYLLQIPSESRHLI